MRCEWNRTLDGFADPFVKDPGDCQAPATVTIGKHPWAFVCDLCVKSKKLKSFLKRSMREGATASSEMDDKGESVGRGAVTRIRSSAVKVLKPKRVEH